MHLIRKTFNLLLQYFLVNFNNFIFSAGYLEVLCWNAKRKNKITSKIAKLLTSGENAKNFNYSICENIKS